MAARKGGKITVVADGSALVGAGSDSFALGDDLAVFDLGTGPVSTSANVNTFSLSNRSVLRCGTVTLVPALVPGVFITSSASQLDITGNLLIQQCTSMAILSNAGQVSVSGDVTGVLVSDVGISLAQTSAMSVGGNLTITNTGTGNSFVIATDLASLSITGDVVLDGRTLGLPGIQLIPGILKFGNLLAGSVTPLNTGLFYCKGSAIISGGNVTVTQSTAPALGSSLLKTLQGWATVSLGNIANTGFTDVYCIDMAGGSLTANTVTITGGDTGISLSSQARATVGIINITATTADNTDPIISVISGSMLICENLNGLNPAHNATLAATVVSSGGVILVTAPGTWALSDGSPRNVKVGINPATTNAVINTGLSSDICDFLPIIPAIPGLPGTPFAPTFSRCQSGL